MLGLDKQQVTYSSNGILVSHKKEYNSDTCYNMDEHWNHYAKWNSQIQRDKYCMMLFVWGIWNKQIHRDRKENNDYQRLTGGQNEEFYNGNSFCLNDEKLLEMDAGDGYSTMWMCLMPLDCMLKNGKF